MSSAQKTARECGVTGSCRCCCGAAAGGTIGGAIGSMAGGSKPKSITADIKNAGPRTSSNMNKTFGGAAKTLPNKAGATGTIQNMPNTPATQAAAKIQPLGTAKMKKLEQMNQAV